MGGPILKLSGIYKQISQGFRLKDINLDLYSGEVHMIIGENGSGKSCIMQVISGVLQPDAGNIELFGKKTVVPSLPDARRMGIVFIMQEPNLLEQLSVAENIFFYDMPIKGKIIKTVDYNLLKKKCVDLFEELGISIDPDLPVSKLGLAQKQLVEFCRACASNAEIVIFDEPTAVFTEVEREILYRIIEKIRKRGAGIFYVSHKLDEIRLIGSRVSVIRQGTVIGTRQVDGTDDEQIIKMLSGLMYTTRYPKLEIPIGEEVFSVRGLCKKELLSDISFSLHKGEILGITGLAGSGRTLLANCIFGAAKYDEGKIFINGEEAKIKSPYDAIKNGIGMIPENRLTDSLFYCLDVKKNVSLVSLRRFLGKGFVLNTNILADVVCDYISKLNIPVREAEENISRISGGQQQKLMVAKWMMSRSKIFILDEPTRGVDVASRIDIYNAVTDIARKGGSVLFISSDIEEILGMCDRVLVLAHGNIVCDLARSEVTKEKIIAYAAEKA